ncbi:sugar transferase [Bizionia paragorgiae]|uniref:Sugar transferase involved in LPS biosynthesis (Colanic, teichoic acid) n=1 Tax=Bizionia paragorgiae TaxID=283786 RepID=A0A1H4D9H6_BIZPA|nr:sugar transferase [Bizionia paragorgiae]SEA68952.1 Sugar transferase involved in LPS biosynthesis (colanic, teichoic acid) [Bizionia paragorgiae]
MYKLFKRLCDIIVSGVALLILAPLLIPIMIGLKLTGEGYIWYKQERVGYKNKPFLIWKFATMLKDSPNMAGGIMTTKKDPRITPMGGFLRKSKINELPQLINIFKGDMSVVGPRPVMQKSFDAYPEDVKQVIYNVKPGLTGIGSVIFRDEEELITEVKNRGEDTWAFYANKIYPFKGQVEQWYQKNESFMVDVKLILATAWVILNPTSEIVYSWFKDLPRRPF